MGLNWILWFPNSTQTKMQTYPIYGFKLDSNQNSSTLNSKIKRNFFSFIESEKKKVKMSVEIDKHMGRKSRKKMIQLFVFSWNKITFRPCLVCLRFRENKFNHFLCLVCISGEKGKNGQKWTFHLPKRIQFFLLIIVLMH